MPRFTNCDKCLVNRAPGHFLFMSKLRQRIRTTQAPSNTTRHSVRKAQVRIGFGRHHRYAPNPCRNCYGRAYITTCGKHNIGSPSAENPETLKDGANGSPYCLQLIDARAAGKPADVEELKLVIARSKQLRIAASTTGCEHDFVSG
jgi:hypothetical protein